MKEAADTKKKRRAEMAQRRHEKEMEITRRVWAGESQSDVEAKLESEEPTEMGGDASSSEDEGGWDVVATSVERRGPMGASISGGRDTERCGNVATSRKCVASLRPRLSAVGRMRRGAAAFPSQGNAS